MNNGTCTDGINSFTCNCVDGFTGENCSTNINDCDHNPCMNNGTCTDGISSFTCNCVDGFTGENCTANLDDCNPNPCMNNGTCTDGINSFTCNCVDGFTGENCTTNIDDCNPNPCLNNGTCADEINSFICTCSDIFTGLICESGMAEPTQPMLNDIITTPYSVNISWLVRNVVFDQENYTIQYGTDETLLDTSQVVEGNSDTLTTDEFFYINVTGLAPYTTYYYRIVAVNSVGSSQTTVMNFTTDEIAPSAAPIGFTPTSITSESVVFQWSPLIDHEANGIVRYYIITCDGSNVVHKIGAVESK
ncbi:delta-like protein B [Dysidea avara]|uniref:delta-like protein B n=1 Tax=Dysidea avara TaxID=196820 RepID=UPI0033212315